MKLQTIIGIFSILFIWGCSQNISGSKGPDGNFDNGEYDEAIGAYQKELEKNPNDPRINFMIAESFQKSNRIKLARGFYETAIENGIDADTALLHYAFSLKAHEDYAGAEKQLKAFLERDTVDKYTARAEKELANLKYLSDLESKQSFFDVSDPSAVNTAAAEYSPFISKGELYFTSNRHDSKIYKTTGTPFTDIYKVKLDGSSVDLGTVELLGDLINTPEVNEGTIAFTQDGNTVVFARGNDGSKKGAKEVNLYISRYRNGAWDEPEYLGINDPDSWDSSPAFNRTGKTLYFASNRQYEGSMGGIDLYRATLDANGRFGRPVNLGKDINTPGDEMFPFVADDGRLLFASSGHPGLGGLDLFAATRQEGKTVVENLGVPMNSPDDDFGMVYASRTTGFFTSNRDGGKGDDDIYAFKDNTPARKIVNYYLAGVTVTPDSLQTGEESLAGVTIELLDTEEKVVDQATTDEEGKFKFTIEGEKDYTLVAKKEDYFTTRLDFSTMGKSIPLEDLVEEVTNKTFDTSMRLDGARVGVEFVLEDIYYEFDSANIQASAAIELDKLVRFLNDNPEIKIELGSHTDSKGPDAYNMNLSSRRAESAVNYVISTGIAKNRIRARGYGETLPRAANENPDGTDNPEGRQLNRRTEIKVFELDKDTGKMEELKDIKKEENEPDPDGN